MEKYLLIYCSKKLINKNMTLTKKMLLSKDILYTLSNQFLKLLSGPLKIFFIPLFLSKEEQGFWYTFASLSALAILADLGFNHIVLQFSAHEFSQLYFEKNYFLKGDKEKITKLASLFTFTLKWSFLASVIAFPLILVFGIKTFSDKQSDVNWFIPWILYLIASGIGFVNSTIIAFLEGFNLVGKIEQIRFVLGILNTFLLVLGLFFGFKLYSLSISLLLSTILTSLYLIIVFKTYFLQLLKEANANTYSWKNDFLKLFWKYAISFACGYFVFEVYTPLMFNYKGAIEAGKVGISLSLWVSILGISSSWTHVIVPKLSMLVAQKNWKELDKIFFKNLNLSILTFVSGFISIFAIGYFFNSSLPIISRFVSPFSMFLLGLAWFIQSIINNLAIYMRAHKEEPFIWISLIGAIYTFISTFFCAKYLDPSYFFIGFSSSYLFVLPIVITIFFKKRKLWHEAQ